MGLPIRSTGLDMHINRALITDKATAEIGLAWCHKRGSVSHLPVTLWEADSRQVCTRVCLKPGTAVAIQRQVLILVVKGNDCLCSLE